MSSNDPSTSMDASALSTTAENEIFKSLSHQTRRDIIKILGETKEATFTEIKNKLTNIDSPTLSYHLKSLNSMLTQQGENYILTDIGQTALLLMDKIDQSDRLKAWKRNMLKSNIWTQVSWILILFLVPFLISNYYSSTTLVWVFVLINVIAQINFQVMWRMFGISYNPGKKQKKDKTKQ
jgi:DNA-binding transcriptional ArsR family regulator